MSLGDFARAPARHQSLYDTIAESHPSLLAGKMAADCCRWTLSASTELVECGLG